MRVYASRCDIALPTWSMRLVHAFGPCVWSMRCLVPYLLARVQTRSDKERPMTTRVLVVDDDADVRRLLRVMLEADGYAVAEAPGGAEALDILRESADRIRSEERR